MQRAAVVVVFLGLVGCGAEPGAATAVRRIAGGKETRYQGVTFDLPAHWQAQQNEGGLQLTPNGANASGLLEEMYLLGGEPGVRSLTGPEAERSIQQSVDQLLPDATKKSGPVDATFGALPGRTWTWTARSQYDKDVELRVFAFMGNHGCALFALGLPDVLAKRQADLAAILGSMTNSAAGGDGKAATGGVAAELVGQWIWMSNVTAQGGGSQTNTWINLQADGRYQWHHDSVSTNPNGAAWGAEDETGQWSAAGASITFRPDRGEPYTQQLAKRNHPKNQNDPMIVLDGKAYVTATSRRPW